jgi:predicted nuclease of predicted toxin-antitoxin system
VKLLFDENLSVRLVELLAIEFPGSTHVELALGRGRSDAGIWQYAIEQTCAIVSKDNDFRQRAFVAAPPPKVIWLAVANAGTEEIAGLLRSRAADVNRFGDAAQESLLVMRP